MYGNDSLAPPPALNLNQSTFCPLFLSLSPSVCIYISSVLLSYPQQLFWPLYSSFLSLHLWLLLSLLSSSINTSFNPLYYGEVSHLLLCLIPPVCPALKRKDSPLPGPTLEWSQALHIAVMDLSQPDMGIRQRTNQTHGQWGIKTHSTTLRKDILLLQQIIKYR